MAKEGPASVVLDASVLINFLVVDQLQLLTEFPTHTYILTGHVLGEVLEESQRSRLTKAIAAEELRLEQLAVDSQEGELFSRLVTECRLGVGECAAIAYASVHKHALAIDDRAARKAAVRFDRILAIFGTEDLVELFIRKGILEVTEADSMKKLWEDKHRFKLPFASFCDRDSRPTEE